MLILTRNSLHVSYTYLKTASRLCHTKKPVRVRFAPSPTGFMHLGGLRTALYNYLFAKANNGKFILRIEDTDQTRLVEGATEQLSKDLEWCGIVPDEGPLQGGDYGPYIQSQRLQLYRTEVKKLLETGNAYYCFCSDRRLDLLRRDAMRQQQIPKYDNRCRHLTPGQIAEKLAKNDQFCVRFKLPSRAESFNDLVYGSQVYFVAQNEGDPVIIKSDGYPTYHLANVVDDHLMKITHVFRGVEWQISTPKHILMYRAFGWTPPQYAHLPLIMNADGSKLSKRQNDIKLDYYRDGGVLPQALLNYITQSGGGFNRPTANNPKCYDMTELAKQFDVGRINTNSSRLNPDLLGQFNRLELTNHLADPVKCEQLVEQVRTLVKTTYPDSLGRLDLDRQHVEDVLRWAVNRIDSLKDLVEGKLSFLWILPRLTKEAPTIDENLLNSLIKTLEDQKFTKAQLSDILKEFSKRNNITFANLMASLRSLLSGLKEGPGVAEMMEILGKENTFQRIIRTIKKKT